MAIPRVKLLALLVCSVASAGLSARTGISLGYGMQLNSMLNSALKTNLQKLVLNQAVQPLVGQSVGTDYSSNWTASASDGEIAPYALVNLPEVRVTSSWVAGNNSLGFFTALTGIVPQTSAYYLGGTQLKETSVASPCSGVNYANCPLAAMGFVGSSGTAIYDTEVRTNLRSFNISGGFTFARKLGTIWSGDFILQAEMGLSIQQFSATTQFAATRCTTGASAPCSQSSQSRVVQGELKTQSHYAFGPQFGLNARYERPQSAWFLEIGLSAVVLFSRLENVGYTNFVAAGTVAFTQTAATLGIDAVQNNIAVLPAVVLRAGYYL